MSCVGLCSCVSDTVCHVLVCDLVSLTLRAKYVSVFLCFLHYVSCVGLCSCVPYTVCHVLVCVIVSLTLYVMCSSVFLLVFVLICII